MCGICGIASNYLSEAELRSWMYLMHLNTWRGWEGAGCVFIPDGLGKKQHPNIVRTLGTGSDLILTKVFREERDEHKNCIALGHTRWPTKGENKLENVHPHHERHIIGVHNGTIRRFDGKYLTDDKQSDSKLLFTSIMERGIKDTIKITEGAYVLVWIDTKEHTLSFLRNYERPLSFARPKAHRSTMWWSSEGEDLERVMKAKSKEEFIIEELPVHQLRVYEYPIKTPIEPIMVEECRPEYKSYFSGQTWNEGWEEPFIWDRDDKGVLGRRQNRHDRHRNFNHVNCTDGKRAGNVTNLSIVGKDDKRLVHKPGYHIPLLPPRVPIALLEAPTERDESFAFETDKNFFVEEDRLNHYLAKGCYFCSAKVDKKDYDENKLHWLSFKEFLCEECHSNDKTYTECMYYFPHLKAKIGKGDDDAA